MNQDLSGKAFGNYQIDELLGTGGMGQVYQGTHLMLGRKAAIKVMHSHLAVDPLFRARFLQEAKAAADLSHPNIIQVYDFGELDGQFYLVMELILDGSLRTWMRDRGSPNDSIDRSIALVQQTAKALGYAHARGVVHRDIKPDNLLIKNLKTQSGSDDWQIKVSDFGLARLAEGVALTVSGVTMGTPAYMSPEQAQGIDLDGRSDIYSLGVVFFELVTGMVPFDTRTISDAVYKHVHVDPPSPRVANPNLPRELESVIMRCLAKKPDERFASASELEQAVSEIAAGVDLDTIIPASTPRQETEGTAGETWLQADSDLPAPQLPPLMGSSEFPRLQIIQQNGQTLRVVELTTAGLIAGRSTDCDLVLPDESVSRNHFRVDWDGSRVTVTDLGSRNGTLLGGFRVLPQVAQRWDAGSWVKAGNYWIMLHDPTWKSVQETTAHPAVGRLSEDDASVSGRIQVGLEQEQLTLVPGKPTSVRGTLANFGRTVDHLRVSVDGVPDHWVRVPDQEVQLNPGAQEAVVISVDVPRVPDSYAGTYHVTVVARSRKNPEEFGSAQADWEVSRFADSELSISPNRSGGRSGASYRVLLSNSGNYPSRYSLRGQDDEEALQYRFGRESVELGAGERETIPLKIVADRQWVGNARDRAFQVRANPENEPPVAASAQLSHKPIIPTWSVPFIVVAAVGLLFLANILLTPTIEAFELDRFDAQYAAGEDVTLSWNVSRARGVDLQNLPEISALGSGERVPNRSSFTFTPTWTGEHSVTLVASNWLRSREQSVRISVLPPDPDAPVIGLFTIEPSSIVAGESVTVSWSVSGADNVVLEMPDGSSRDGLPAQGQLPDSPGQTGAYILKASFDGISAPPQLREIQVSAQPEQPPNGGGDDGADDGEPPLPVPPPSISISPASGFELVEGACVEFEWEFQNVQSVMLDGDPVAATGEAKGCPEETTTFEWAIVGEDGENYLEARNVVVAEPFEVDDGATIGHFIGAWSNMGSGTTFGVTRIEIDDVGDGDVAVRVWMRCSSPDHCSPAAPGVPAIPIAGGFGIFLGVEFVPDADLPKLIAEVTHEADEYRFLIGREDDELLVRVFYFDLGLLHEFTLVEAGPPGSDMVISIPDDFFEDPLWEAPDN